jgi:hypothetical protein
MKSVNLVATILASVLFGSSAAFAATDDVFLKVGRSRQDHEAAKADAKRKADRKCHAAANRHGQWKLYSGKVKESPPGCHPGRDGCMPVPTKYFYAEAKFGCHMLP